MTPVIPPLVRGSNAKAPCSPVQETVPMEVTRVPPPKMERATSSHQSVSPQNRVKDQQPRDQRQQSASPVPRDDDSAREIGQGSYRKVKDYGKRLDSAREKLQRRGFRGLK